MQRGFVRWAGAGSARFLYSQLSFLFFLQPAFLSAAPLPFGERSFDCDPALCCKISAASLASTTSGIGIKFFLLFFSEKKTIEQFLKPLA